MDFEWSHEDIENAKNRTDPDLSDEEIIKILNEAVRRTGQRSGILFNRAVVRVFEEYRDQGILEEKIQKRKEQYRVKFDEDVGLVDKLRISMDELFEIIDAFGLSISKEELLENEDEITNIIENALINLDSPFNSMGKLSLIAKRRISQELEEWKRNKEKQQKSDVNRYKIEFEENTSLSSKTLSAHSSSPSIPQINDHNSMVPQLQDKRGLVENRSISGENRIIEQLKYSRLENISLPTFITKFHLDSCYDALPDNEMFNNFDVLVEFLNYLEEGVRIVPSENDSENDYFVMVGTGNVQFFRKEGKQVIEPPESKLNLLIFNPEDMSIGCEMEIFSGSHDLVLDVVYSRFSDYFNRTETALEQALKQILSTRGGTAFGLTEGKSLEDSLNELIAKKSSKELVSIIEENSDIIGANLARESIKSLTQLSEKIAVFPLDYAREGINLLAILDFLNRYGGDSSYMGKIRRLTLNFTHKQKELFNVVGEETIKRLRKSVMEESVSSMDEIGKVGVLFIEKSNPYPFVISISSKELMYSVTSPFNNIDLSPESPISKKLMKILINLVPLSHKSLKSLLEPLKIRSPLLKALRKMKEIGDPFINSIHSLDDYLTIPLTVYYYVYNAILNDPSLAGLEKEDIDKWKPQFIQRLCYYLLTELVENIREKSKVYTKPADPMKKQFMLFNNMDIFLSDPSKLDTKIEEMWNWIHKAT